MTENNRQFNSDPSPFRRYVPSPRGDIQGGNVSSASKPLPLKNPPSPSIGVTPPRSRHPQNIRGRWRKWIQSTSQSKQSNSLSSSSSSSSHPQRQGPSRSIKDPLESFTREAQPMRPSQYSVPHSVQPTLQHSSPRTVQRKGTASTQPRPQQKVTSLRQKQPVWSTPVEPTSPKPPPSRRDSKSRRLTKKAPRPILYGIRLLILGTGIAAIAGTVLSSLSSQAERTAANQSNGRQTEVANRPNRSSRNLLTAAAPLPLAEELISVETDLVALESMTPGLEQSVFLYDLDTGNYIDLNGTKAVSAASTIKVPILVAFLQAVDSGTVRLDQAIILQENLIASGSGDMQFQDIGSQYTALEVVAEMIVNSDNTATNLIITLLGGTDVLNTQFQRWGLENTVLRNLLPDLDGTNTTSSADLVRIMTLVDRGDLLSLRSRDRLFSIMQRTYNRTLIPDGLEDETAVAYNKTGDIGTSLGDVALVDAPNGKRYVVSVLVDRPFNDGRASELIRRAASRVHQEMSQPISPTGSGALTPSPETSYPEGDNSSGSPEMLPQQSSETPNDF